ncbi:uncharacterized protein MKK02DRAFT_37637 [Dioszegia hungarica]|uniref:DUF6534 domain-containing protein n=1 Tax=Dioszegia hungarica TaxID=4972 RepID=A0AA38H699_9TREE|nr:uncharacterized protein MKK02DRAFT_37637 [Dioszegia hungarica]KAI9634760.1 hypothetical protein MKK02DRAFT_37637 [Dioszegia hungarica]
MDQAGLLKWLLWQDAKILLGQVLVFTCFLYGVFLSCFASYLQFSYKAEKRPMRALILAATLATLTTIYVMLFNCRLFIVRNGKIPVPEDTLWTAFNWPLDGATYALVVGFYAHRAWNLHGRSVYLAILLCTMILITTAAALGASVTVMLFIWVYGDPHPGGNKAKIFNAFNYVFICGQMTSDVIVSGLIVYKLLKLRTGWKETDSLLSRLAVLAVETQLPSTIFAIAFLVGFTQVISAEYLSLFMCFPLVYTCCFIASLNARNTLSASLSNELSAVSSQKDRSWSTGRSIQVTTETSTDADTIITQKKPLRGHGRLSSVDSNPMEMTAVKNASREGEIGLA